MQVRLGLGLGHVRQMLSAEICSLYQRRRLSENIQWNGGGRGRIGYVFFMCDIWMVRIGWNLRAALLQIVGEEQFKERNHIKTKSPGVGTANG